MRRLLDAPRRGVEVVERGDLTFLINHTDRDAEVPFEGEPVTLEAFGVRISPGAARP